MITHWNDMIYGVLKLLPGSRAYPYESGGEWDCGFLYDTACDECGRSLGEPLTPSPMF